jgi:Tol biopolymer transport system component
VDELTLLRQFVVDEPMADEAARAEVWRRLHEGQTLGRRRMTVRHSEEAIGRRQGARPLRLHGGRRRRGGRVAVAAAILVGGLLVTPALGLGDRLLGLIRSTPTPLDVQTPAWSPDGRELAFVSRRDGNFEIYVINADGSGQENLTQHPARDSHPSWSRDGRKLAFVSRRDGNSEIYVMNADGSGLRNVTRAPSNDLGPAWSPDGRAIAFVKMIQKKCAPNSTDPRCDGNDYETFLYVVNGDGSGLRRLTTHPEWLFNPSWSADGKTIRYGRYLVQADGSGQTELPRNVAFGGAWSPDGKRIAYAVIDTSPGDRTDDADAGLWVVNADGSNPRQLARNAAGSNPAWSPDGRRIAFRRYPQGIGSAGPSGLFVVNADGSGLRRLTRHEENVPRSFAWSPDGRTMAFLHNREVYIVKADGSDERRLTQLNK